MAKVLGAMDKAVRSLTDRSLGQIMWIEPRHVFDFSMAGHDLVISLDVDAQLQCNTLSVVRFILVPLVQGKKKATYS